MAWHGWAKQGKTWQEVYCTALHFNAIHCTALHYTALHCTSLHYTALWDALWL